MNITIERRGQKICLYAQMTSQNGNEATVLTGTMTFSIAAVGDAKSVSKVSPVDPALTMSIQDARRLARQILSDTSQDSGSDKPLAEDITEKDEGGGI